MPSGWNPSGNEKASGSVPACRDASSLLSACAGAPMMVVDGHYHEKLTPESLDAILDSLD